MIYLDNAATSFAKPKEVVMAVCDAACRGCANPGRGGHSLSVSAGEVLYNTRGRIAELFNISDPERIAFCKNTTEALNFGIKGVMHNGGHIITTSMEHNSVIRPIKALGKQGVTHSILQADAAGNLDINRLEKMIRRDTRLIVMTHSSNVCGNIYDIEKAAQIARRNNVLFMVDAAQSAGTVQIDAQKVDLLAFPGHKGMLGPMGTGGLYVAEGVKIASIIEGGTGSVSESLTQPEFFPDILESGTQNVPAIAGLGAAAEFLLKEGVWAIRGHENELCKRFEDEIKNIENITIYGSGEKTAITAFNIVGADCVEVAQILNDRYGIATRAGLHCAYLAHKSLKTEEIGCVRASFGYFNTQKEVDYAADCLYKISKDLQI
ncbi:MAG: aminotransferase class V-fold PLP-dependent enzyme [Clostridia bacterium]|nr:aminotransferase class V-fold PLP-dependent enzyme [Clostridia bacterium]